MKFKLVEALNRFEYKAIDRGDNVSTKYVDAYSYKQAVFLIKKDDSNKGCLIRDIVQITDNKDPEQMEIDLDKYR